MDKNMSANIAGIAGALAMMGVSMASRKMGFSYGDSLADDVAHRAVNVADEASAQGVQANAAQEEAIGMGTHLGFSMSSAMLYSRVRKHVGLPGPVAGALFGLGIWAVNVVGVAPMLGIRSVPWRQDEGRAATTILAHLAFGAVLGVMYDQLVVDEEEEG